MYVLYAPKIIYIYILYIYIMIDADQVLVAYRVGHVPQRCLGGGEPWINPYSLSPIFYMAGSELGKARGQGT